MNIINSSALMKSLPSNEVALETECLFGEKIEILKKNDEWVYCKLATDNYLGWIKKNNVGTLENPTHRVLSKRTFIYKDKNPKSNCLIYLSMGSKLFIEKIQNGWAKTIFFKNKNKIIGYVPMQHIVELNNKIKDWVKIAQQLIDTPYRWGGRDTIGIDCSALLQLSYQTYGQDIPRNTSQQIQLNKKIIKDVKNLRRGNVIFWKGHVGIMIDPKNCIHSNAFHMKTIVEPLAEIIKRMEMNYPIVKIMDFN